MFIELNARLYSQTDSPLARRTIPVSRIEEVRELTGDNEGLVLIDIGTEEIGFDLVTDEPYNSIMGRLAAMVTCSPYVGIPD